MKHKKNIEDCTGDIFHMELDEFIKGCMIDDSTDEETTDNIQGK